MSVAAILFDKDGTLFDFTATWAPFTRAAIETLGGGDPARVERFASAVGFEPGRGRFDPDSPVIAGTARDAALVLSRAGAGPVEQIESLLVARAAAIEPVPAVDLPALIALLRGRGLALGVMTNDAEGAAHAHLDRAGLAGAFDFVAGYDSGHGAKPDPAPLLAFARACGIAAGAVAMVGDSLHDLHAARDAGMRGVGVETGPAPRATLAAAAEIVLPDIGHLPSWLDTL